MFIDFKKTIISAAVLLPTMGIISNANNIDTLIIDSSVNFRVGPSVSHDKIDKLEPGTKVEYISTSGSWYKIKYNNRTGYIHSKYASVNSSEKETSQSNNSYKYVNCSSLNLRKGAGTNYSVIKSLSKGTKVKVISSTNNWSKVSVGDTYGYVHSSYLSSYSSSTESNTVGDSNEVKSFKYVNTSSLNFRKGPSTSYESMYKLSKDTKVGVISTSNGWTKIKHNNNYGYVSSSYLSTSKSSNSTSSNTTSSSTSNSAKLSKIVSLAKSKLGCKYVRGSEGPSTFDCTGLTYYLYKQVGITISRSPLEQAKNGTYVSKSDLKPGDLIFMDTKGNPDIDHGGIYVGNNTVIHANSVAGKVVASDLNSNYYRNAYVTARRIIK